MNLSVYGPMVWNIAKLVILLGSIILVHELGHFIAARLFGVKVLKFSIGFPPKIFGFKRGETEYVIGATPLGGYVKLAGEDWDTGEELKPDDLMAKPYWVRMIMYSAGVFMNAVLAWVIFFGLFLHGIEFNRFPSKLVVNPGGIASKAGLRTGDVIVKADGKTIRTINELEGIYSKAEKNAKVKIEVKRNSELLKMALPVADDPGIEPYVEPVISEPDPFQPAEKAGMKGGDRVISINGKKVAMFDDMKKIVSVAKEGSVLNIRVLRDGKKLDFKVKPRFDAGMNRSVIGIAAKSSDVGTENWGVVDSAGMATRSVKILSSEIISSVWRVITGKSKFKDVLGGPVLIGRVGYAKARQGIADLLHFVAALSVSLMVVNLLPIPAVDGGMIVMALLEGIRGKRFSAKTYQNFVTVGFAFLMAVYLLATYHDILR